MSARRDGLIALSISKVDSGVASLMPRITLIREFHGGVPFAKHFRNSIHEFRELLNFFSAEVLAETRMESPARFDFFAGDVRHHADEFDLASCLTSWRGRRARRRRFLG